MLTNFKIVLTALFSHQREPFGVPGPKHSWKTFFRSTPLLSARENFDSNLFAVRNRGHAVAHAAPRRAINVGRRVSRASFWNARVILQKGWTSHYDHIVRQRPSYCPVFFRGNKKGRVLRERREVGVGRSRPGIFVRTTLFFSKCVLRWEKKREENRLVNLLTALKWCWLTVWQATNSEHIVAASAEPFSYSK